MSVDYEKILSENQARLSKIFYPYNPLTGLGSQLTRIEVSYVLNDVSYRLYLPEPMMNYDFVQDLKKTGDFAKSVKNIHGSFSETIQHDYLKEFIENRLDCDFEFWAYTNLKIQDKESKQLIPFRFNHPQRVFAKIQFEDFIFKNIPIRVDLLKSRQWGGSTEIESLFFYIQVRLKTNWHGAIIADVEDQSRNIRSMYTKFANNYESEKLTFKSYEGSSKNRILVPRGNIIGIGSAKEPDNVRSFDYSMLHGSEVGMWKSTEKQSAEDLMASTRAAVSDVPLSAIILESTAKGVRSFWHKEWLAAKKGKSGYYPLFIPFFMVERYHRAIEDHKEFIEKMNDEDWYLWQCGASLEAVNWYNYYQSKENYSDLRMKREFPPTDTDAFQSSGSPFFPVLIVEEARKTCMKPEFVGELVGDADTGEAALENLTFEKNDNGRLLIWQLPDNSEQVANRYLTTMDIGGASEGADWTVIRVFDRYWLPLGGAMEVVATWRGHIDPDLGAWIAAQIAQFYNEALLGIESNTLESRDYEGDNSTTVLAEIADYYNNIFTRTDPEKIKEGVPLKYGIHTNPKTKNAMTNSMKADFRKGKLVERFHLACDEMEVYEIKENGTRGAVDGEHDDIVMSTAIGSYISMYYMDLPYVIKWDPKKSNKQKLNSAADI